MPTQVRASQTTTCVYGGCGTHMRDSLRTLGGSCELCIPSIDERGAEIQDIPNTWRSLDCFFFLQASGQTAAISLQRYWQ